MKRGRFRHRLPVFAPLVALLVASPLACSSTPDDGAQSQDDAIRARPLPVLGVVMSIDSVLPAYAWENRPLTISYTVLNASGQHAGGTITGTFEGAALTPVGPNVVDLQSGQSFHGQLVTNANLKAGTSTLRLSYADQVKCWWNPIVHREICTAGVSTSATQEITVYAAGNILDGLDALPALGPATGAICGGAPGHTYGKSTDVNDEWVESQGGGDVPMAGLVFYPKAPGTDVPWSHPFGADRTWHVQPDPQYFSYLNDPDIAAKADCSPAGLSSGKGDGDICQAFVEEKEEEGSATGAVHCEVENGLLPDAYAPQDGDRIFMHGHRIVDCGHDNYTAEMHPPVLIARAKTDATTGATRSTLIVMPYHTKQTYSPSGNHFIGTAAGDLIGASLSPFGAPLNLLVDIDNVPFDRKIIANYRVSVPPRPDKPYASFWYQFFTRPGVGVQVTPLNNYQAQVTVTLDPATYQPFAPPSCQTVNFSLEQADSYSGYSLGTIRSALDGIAVASGLALGLVSPGLLIAVNNGLYMKQCTVPNATPRAPDSWFTNSVQVDASQPYPAYGWLDVVYDSTPQTLSLTKTGDGTVSGPQIDCGSSCSADYPRGTLVTLMATPNTGASFTGWTGACSGTGPCTITMDAAKSVGATFTSSPGPQHTLTVNLVQDATCTGYATGDVQTNPALIHCHMPSNASSTSCSAPFPAGSAVSLSATAGAITSFTAFSGAGCSGKTCNLTMTSDQTVTATFCGLIQ